MQLTYYPEINVAYLRFKKKTGKVRSVAVSDEVNVDLAADGSVYGIELLNANAQLVTRKKKTIVLINEGSGEKCALPLAG